MGLHLQYSLRALFGLVFVFAVCLALAKMSRYYMIVVLPVYVASVGLLVKQPSVKRALIWGPLLGACVFFFVGLTLARLRGEELWHLHRPFETTTQQIAVPIGGFVGGIVGLLVAGAVSGRKPPES